MKTLNMILMLVMVMAITACGGSGGGGGGGGGTPTPDSPVGTATYDNLSSGSQNNVCFKSSGSFGTAGSCDVAGTPSTQYSDSICSAGTKRAICTVGSRSYTLSTAGGIAEDNACYNAGGSISVSCPILTQGACNTAGGNWTAPTNPDVSTPSNCSAQGGSYYTNLNSLTGDFSAQSIGVGSNRVTSDPTEVATAMGLFNGAFDLDNTNITLVTMTATLTIDNKWESAVVMTPSVYNMTATSVQLDVVSPAATNVNSAISIKDSSIVLYYY